ncbi:MAG: hypothetical protein AABW91_04625 [Nanoarchaeota archaeon]
MIIQTREEFEKEQEDFNKYVREHFCTDKSILLREGLLGVYNLAAGALGLGAISGGIALASEYLSH